MLKDKKILLGITGSIAAYKAILLVRLLIKAGATVKIVMTPAAKDFVSVLTLSTLSRDKVLVHLAEEDTWANHVMLGRWADVMVIAPLSCNTMAKMAAGACDNLLLAAYLSATCPVVVAPAMDEDMWHHSTVKRNLATLESFGNQVISVGKGELASGLFGEGRMAEPQDIVTWLEENHCRGSILNGFNALVTAGPTYEAIDLVRFIGNHSSGKMGFAIAEAMYLSGATVHLITGPTALEPKYIGIQVTRVQSAAEMYDAAVSAFPDSSIAIMSAAVADFSPTEVSMHKIKKTSSLTISLTKTKDILQSLGALKKKDQLLVGFALETQNERENAINKLVAKNADLIVLNSLNDEDVGFGKSTNRVTIFDRAGNEFAFPAKSKTEVAQDIIDLIVKKINEKA